MGLAVALTVVVTGKGMVVVGVVIMVFLTVVDFIGEEVVVLKGTIFVYVPDVPLVSINFLLPSFLEGSGFTY